MTSPRITCKCGAARFIVDGKNLLKCQKCGRQTQITPDLPRWFGPSTLDLNYDRWAEQGKNETANCGWVNPAGVAE